jgi:hypothetical protein
MANTTARDFAMNEFYVDPDPGFLLNADLDTAEIKYRYKKSTFYKL